MSLQFFFPFLNKYKKNIDFYWLTKYFILIILSWFYLYVA